jgi:hypothetical protein
VATTEADADLAADAVLRAWRQARKDAAAIA